MKPTLRDIARLANVHYATVSHVLNGSSGSTRVSEDTRRRVLEVAESLGYVANRAAQQLKTQRSRVVGVLSGALENPFFARLVSLCEAALERQGYDMVLTVRRQDETRDLHLLEALLSRQLDGLLVWSETLTEARVRVQQPDMAKTVVMGFDIPGRDCVAADLETGVKAALEHLRQQGCQRIGYFAPADTLDRYGEPRHDLYAQYAADYGQAVRIYSFEGAMFNMEAARLRAEALADDSELPDALICFNDVAAMGALMGLRRRGLSVPEDIALVGCDDLPIVAQLDVPLTTVRYPLEEMCAEAVAMLMERITESEEAASKTPARKCLLPTALQVRASSLRTLCVEAGTPAKYIQGR